MGLLSALTTRRARAPAPPPPHYHYCDGGDHEWPHEEAPCLWSWVRRCGRCRPSAPAPVDGRPVDPVR